MAFGRNQAMRSIRLPHKLSHTPVFIHLPIICETILTKNKYNSCNCYTQGAKYTANRPVWQFLFFNALCTAQCYFNVQEMDATSAINPRYQSTLSAMNHHQLLVSCPSIVQWEWSYSIIKLEYIVIIHYQKWQKLTYVFDHFQIEFAARIILWWKKLYGHDQWLFKGSYMIVYVVLVSNSRGCCLDPPTPEEVWHKQYTRNHVWSRL